MIETVKKDEKLEIKKNNDVDVKNITVNYSDGTKKIIEKGLVCQIGNSYDDEQEEEMLNLSMEMASMSGKDLINFVYGMMNLYAKLEENSESDEELLEEK